MVTNVVTHQGIMAIIEKPNLKENKIDYEDKNFLILDGIQDPRKYRNYIKNCR